MKKTGLLAVGLMSALLATMTIDHHASASNTSNKASTNVLNKINEKQVTKTFIGRGDALKDQERQLRYHRYSSLEPIGLYAEAGDKLTVEVKNQDNLVLTVGSPAIDATQKKYDLKQGTNTIDVTHSGAIYITNSNNSGSAEVSVTGATGDMPYFDLNKTTVEDFNEQMKTETNAKNVQLVSDKAIITVSYAAAKKYLGDPEVLMKYYDKFLLAQDKVSGINDSGDEVNHTDRHFQHFVEAKKLYMFTTDEYMGFNGDAALSRLLKTNNGWGVWHESGHQRQQMPWKWSAITESSVNIYSMAAQKELNGVVTAMDEYYPQMHSYLNSSNKDYNSQDNNLKMVMFGQLSNTFGDNFYPVLHQLYRKNKESYSNENDQIQHFILNTSEITGYNLAPYFKEWGLPVDQDTIKKMNTLNDLPEEIWLNDDKVNKKLPMRLLESVRTSEDKVTVNLTNYEVNIFEGQEISLKVNGEYVSGLNDKIPDNSSLKDNIWVTDLKLKDSDNVKIEVKNNDGVYTLYDSSPAAQLLMDEITEFLNSKKPIEEIINQKELDSLRNRISALPKGSDKTKLLSMFDKLEQNYLEAFVKDISINDEGIISIEFLNDTFKNYSRISILGNDSEIAEITHGDVTGGTLAGNTLNIVNQSDQSNISVKFELPNKSYTVGKISMDELLLKKSILALFKDDKHLKEDVTQDDLDNLRTKINEISESHKDDLTKLLNQAQQLYFEQLVKSMEIQNGKLLITFANDLFKNYKIVLLNNNSYLAEVTQGKAYYGTLNGRVFQPGASVISKHTYQLQVRHSSGYYKIQKITVD